MAFLFTPTSTTVTDLGMSTVSASGVEAIEKTIEVEPLQQISDTSIEEIYDVEGTAQELVKGGWKRVCLQFPDELLHDSVPVFKALRSRLEDTVELYVMADTTYGSCCVDEVAAQHVDAQVVVHYGHACLSAPARLAVLYVFPKSPIVPKEAAAKLADEVQKNLDVLENRKNLLLLSDVAYQWKLDEIFEELHKQLSGSFRLTSSHIDTKAYLQPASGQAALSVTRNAQAGQSACCKGGGGNIQDLLPTPQDAPAANCCGSSCCVTEGSTPRRPDLADSAEPTAQVKRASCRTYTLPAGTTLARDFAILYIGQESLAMNNLLLSDVTVPIFSYLPVQKTARLESGRANKMLMRRYGVVSKARDADVYGIVVGTLGVSSYLPTLAYLRKLLRKHKKKAYTMAVGKLTPAKLGNFLEVETWVLVACGENSLVEAHKDFMRPIITPWELEVALGEREWVTGAPAEEGAEGAGQGKSKSYTLDFTDVLNEASAMGKENVDGPEVVEDTGYGEVIGDDPEGPIFSTATGQYRYRKTYGNKDDIKDAGDLTAKAQALSIRNQQSALSTVLSSAGGEFLASRTYQGLDPRYGQDAPSAIEIGRSGIARGYDGDRSAASTSSKQAP